MSKRYLGIEFGSTRIKAVVINDQYKQVDSGIYTWESVCENGIWTYDLTLVWQAIKDILSQIENRSDITAMGISGMMHGYLAFDKDWNLLVPFRTWQNTITGPAALELTEAFGFNIPQRWSIAHLYQAILNNEPHVSQIAHISTLSGYVHYMLTGVNAVGVGEASGMFPIDSQTGCYNQQMLSKFNELTATRKLPWKLADILPSVLSAGDPAGALTEAGASLLGGLLPSGIPFAPCEGDAGTGMVATNAITPGTGNISAGTSIFSMVVLERALKHVYDEIDLVTTPTGKPVAMVHCNNCTNDSNAWVSVLQEVALLFESQPTTDELYTRLYQKSLEGEADCGGILVCNYIAGEGITHMDEGRPLVVRLPGSHFTLANFFRACLYSTMATLKLGMDILTAEQVSITTLTGHGGLFKTPGVGQRFLASACNTPVTCMESAGEGGSFGMALLVAYAHERSYDETLDDFLNIHVFANTKHITLHPENACVEGFESYMNQYKKLLCIERTAIETL